MPFRHNSRHRNHENRNKNRISEDKGELLENYCYTLFRDTPAVESIQFWRTQKGQEVDFVLGDLMGNHRAFEVKFSADSFDEKRYRYFNKSHSDISLSCLSATDVFELSLANLIE